MLLKETRALLVCCGYSSLTLIGVTHYRGIQKGVGTDWCIHGLEVNGSVVRYRACSIAHNHTIYLHNRTIYLLEALVNQGVPTQYIRIFRELYSNFTTRISPFYDDITIDVRRGVRQSDTVSPKLFTATLEDVMRRLEWDNMGVRVDGRLLHHLRFADDIVLITPSISQAERMLADFDDACGKIGLQLNLTKTTFMRNGWVPDAPLSLNATTIFECPSYVYLFRGVNMMNDLAPKLGRRKRAAW
ncbi:hypothetical protein Y032_0171g296 [Ancylostoma ceylanicum]|uniref:Reverse transcriptase domain-containing protein n=1 Tax=Ancylostoma ceylanicum TaxID=53326 RepID=A0A016SUP4_9BILA|nr:hypothetical protein Y032_0171g296 [Ancylostoma ceylanicum]